MRSGVRARSHAGPVEIGGVRIGLRSARTFGSPTSSSAWPDRRRAPHFAERFPYWQTSRRADAIAVARVVETGPAPLCQPDGRQDELVFDGARSGNSDRTRASRFRIYKPASRSSAGARREGLALHRRPSGGASIGGPPTGRPASWACAITWKNGFKASCSASPAASTRASVPPSRLTRSAPSGCAASCCLPLHGRGKPQGRRRLRRRLGVQYDILPIAPGRRGFRRRAAAALRRPGRDVPEENIPSRTRGTALMALSNKLGLMLLTTGNKSEVSVGYSTSMAT